MEYKSIVREAYKSSQACLVGKGEGKTISLLLGHEVYQPDEFGGSTERLTFLSPNLWKFFKSF